MFSILPEVVFYNSSRHGKHRKNPDGKKVRHMESIHVPHALRIE